MTYADSSVPAFISGLRGIVEYLESNPEIPAPIYSTVHTFPAGDWPTMCAEIDAIAALLGVTAHVSPSGHYVAVRSFGPVEYRAVAIPRTTTASKASKRMSPIIVLAGVGVMAVSAAVTLAVLIIGIHRGDRRHLASAPRSNSDAFARLLLGVRYPAPSPESADEKTEAGE